MKKHGYTLAETLITLGIIGIAATLLSPMFRQLIPSKEKMEFMECYKLLTNALPAIDYTPKDGNYKYVYDYDKETGTVYANCLGIACVDDIASEINRASSSSVFSWSGGNGGCGQYKNNTTLYCSEAILTCTSTKSNNSFTFYLDGNGTLKGLDDRGIKFMKDQFNYYKKDNENEE